jgi:integrase
MKSLDRVLRTVRRELHDYLGLAAASFSKADLRAARDRIGERGALTQSNRFLAFVSPILKWADSEDLIEHDFSRAVLRLGCETKRERVLSPDELTRVWRAAGAMTGIGASYGRLLKFLVLTGCRKMEGARLKHGDVLDGIWRQGADNKSSRPHRLRLPAAALALIGQGEARDLVFAGRGGGVLNGFASFKAALDKASAVVKWRMHDLRRTMASSLQELGVEPSIIHSVLNHRLAGLSQIYLRAELEQAKAEALQRWALELERIVGEPGGNARAFSP